MDIIIKTVPNDEIKLRKGFTGADWWWDPEGNLQVRVAAELADWRERACLMIHEAAEALMCRHMGVTVAAVDEFDKKYKQDEPNDVDAGDEPEAPYRVQHNYATAIERVLAGVLEVNWKPYDDRLGKI